MTINTTALIRATIATIWFVVVVTIAAEFSAPLKNLFVMIGGHHWTGKSIAAVAGFIACYLLHVRAKETEHPERGVMAAVWSTVLGGALVFGFFVWHFFTG
jgi:hypothetical protein